LRERGASVKVVMTAAAKQFITPLSGAALSGDKVYDDLFSLTDEAEMGHIELSRAADLVVVAPATADILARMAHGLANDLATTLLLATDKKTLVAPAMNVRMWAHAATQRNVEMLRQAGVLFCGPDEGEMACGEFGAGRMAEPLAIVGAIETAMEKSTLLELPKPLGKIARPEPSGRLNGMHVIVTAGPTHEPIDPVRYIGNRSSGRQGYAIAQAALNAGARVTLISGPVSLTPPSDAELIKVDTAEEMLGAAMKALPADVFIATAAVADWRVDRPGTNKIKKSGKGPPVLKLVENPDILATVARMKEGRPRLVVGFAAETKNLTENARKKLIVKGSDLVVANSVAPGSKTFGGTTNSVQIVSRDRTEAWPELDKTEVAGRLVEHLAGLLDNHI
jgi:phosphopantothenoylcysteine decarboxylase/phosphopantothenate--cysteine ligase